MNQWIQSGKRGQKLNCIHFQSQRCIMVSEVLSLYKDHVQWNLSNMQPQDFYKKGTSEENTFWELISELFIWIRTKYLFEIFCCVHGDFRHVKDKYLF